MTDTCRCIIGNGIGRPALCGRPAEKTQRTATGLLLVYCADHWRQIRGGAGVEVLAEEARDE